MAFPFLFYWAFEDGTRGPFDSETDTGSLLDFAHYSDLARFPWSQCAPFRGAYCMRVRPADTNDHTLVEAGLGLAASQRAWFRWYLYLAPDFEATANDTFNIWELQAGSNGTTVQIAVGLRITATTDAVEIGIGAVAPTVFGASTLDKNVWHCIEVDATIDSGGGNDGRGVLYVDGAAVAVITGLDQSGTVGTMYLGTQDTAATTTGTMLFDEVLVDENRPGPIAQRFPTQVQVVATSHVFVGPGIVENVTLQSGAGTDNVLTIYDTDAAIASDFARIAVELKNVSNNDVVDPAGMPITLTRGCFVSLYGTNPRANIKLGPVPGHSAAGVRSIGQRRTQKEII